MQRYNVHCVDPKKDKCSIKIRRSIPYAKVERMLMEGHTVHLDMDRRAASYARKQLESRLKVAVEMLPGECNGVDGYFFQVGLVRNYLAREKGS